LWRGAPTVSIQKNYKTAALTLATDCQSKRVVAYAIFVPQHPLLSTMREVTGIQPNFTPSEQSLSVVNKCETNRGTFL
jgi:hypothetical protein